MALKTVNLTLKNKKPQLENGYCLLYSENFKNSVTVVF